MDPRTFVIGIDPGSQVTGVAVLDGATREVVSAHAIRAPKDTAGIEAVASQIRTSSISSSVWKQTSRIIIEAQDSYASGPNSRNKINPNSLALLTLISGAWIERALRHRVLDIWHPKPSIWKGQIPKARHAEIILEKAGLRPMEFRTRFDLPTREASDVIDAIGLAQYGLETYRPSLMATEGKIVGRSVLRSLRAAQATAEQPRASTHRPSS